MHRRIALLVIFLAITACTGDTGSSAAPSDITARAETWQTAMQAKDIEALVALYTNDARIMPPNNETVIGGEAVRMMFGGMIDAGIGIKLATVEAKTAGDIGYRVGTYEIMAEDQVVDVGKYIETWQRGDDGEWRIANDAWSSDRPPAAAEKPEAHLMIVHEVDDAERWMAAWRGENSRHKLFRENGAAHVHAFRSTANPNLTGLVVAVEDMEALNTMLQSEEGMAAAAEDGVRAETLQLMPEAK